MFALNVIYILVAMLLILLGAYARLSAVVTNISICGGIIACGVFLALIASLGIFATSKHNQIALFFYIIILFLLFLVQFSIACACLAVNEKMEKYLVSRGWENSRAAQIDVMTTFNCCGLFENDLDHAAALHCNDLHLHCCRGIVANSSACCTGITKGSRYSDCPCVACWAKLYNNLDAAVKVTGGVGLLFSFTEIIGVWLAVRFRNQRDPIADPKSFL